MNENVAVAHTDLAGSASSSDHDHEHEHEDEHEHEHEHEDQCPRRKELNGLPFGRSPSC